jgi:hypothetical protein
MTYFVRLTRAASAPPSPSSLHRGRAAYPFGAPLLALCALALCALAIGCDEGRPGDERGQSVGYRSGTVADNYLSSGERGNMNITEVHWAGSVRVTPTGERVHDPDDVFIELQNKHPRPIFLTRWQLVVTVVTGHPRDDVRFSDLTQRPPSRTYLLPERENKQPIAPTSFVVIAAKRDGAFPNADFYLEDLKLPRDNFDITILDIDDRLIDPAGNARWRVYAGAWDLVTARSMERIQQVFANVGSRETAWHSYSLSDQAATETERALHADLTQNVAPDYRQFTLCSPGRANSPDYSGNTSFGDFN